MREALQVPDYPRYRTPIAELREALRKLGGRDEDMLDEDAAARRLAPEAAEAAEAPSEAEPTASA